jgi:hypothetical protein
MKWTHLPLIPGHAGIQMDPRFRGDERRTANRFNLNGTCASGTRRASAVLAADAAAALRAVNVLIRPHGRCGTMFSESP